MDSDDSAQEAAFKDYMTNLNAAHIHAQQALDALYEEKGPKRGILYRMRLGRAQNALIGLYVRELARSGKK